MEKEPTPPVGKDKSEPPPEDHIPPVDGDEQGEAEDKAQANTPMPTPGDPMTPEWFAERRKKAADALLNLFHPQYVSDPDFELDSDEPPHPESVAPAIAYLIDTYFSGGWQAAAEWLNLCAGGTPSV